ncbi:MAG: S8 family serine peptidase [Propionicimonas sp.]|uniref:S8 family serine peptidase n=1 Tax=Propionicimonas sp. TaxID=1955623 RepID=UPI003D0BDA17
MPRRSMVATAAALALIGVALPATPGYAEGSRDDTPALGVRTPDRTATGRTTTSRTNTIIVTFDRDQSHPSRAGRDVVAQAAETVAGAEVTKVQPITDDTVAVTLDTSLTADQQAEVGTRVEDVDGVAAAEPSVTFRPTSTDDTYYDYLWNLASGSSYGVDAEDAWPATTGSGVVVGVVDTGITAHPDLTGSRSSITGGNVVAGYDFISDSSTSGDGDGRDADPTDEGDYCTSDGTDSSWHGTHVAGIVAAIRNNSEGVVGVAPGAKVQPLRALGNCGGETADIIAALRWGAGLTVSGITATNPTPVDVLNLSLGGTGTCSTAMQNAINDVVAAGATVVVAAGNDGTSLSTSTPANCQNVIRVTATSHGGTRASYSNYGTSSYPATVAAPGGTGASQTDATAWIVSTWNSGTTTAGDPSYVGMAGTSMAAPHVSATIALLKSLDPALTPAQLTAILTDTATPLSSTCSTAKCGAGIVDAAAAVSAESAMLAGFTAKVTGTAKVGTALTATITPSSSATTTSYQWLRDGTAISGATSRTYTAVAKDAGTTLSVRAEVSIGSVSDTVTASAGTVAKGSFTRKTSPSTSGTFKVGRTVTAKKGTWSPTPTSYSYRWLRAGSAIKGATKSTYTLTRADKGRKISVTVTVSRGGYTTTSWTTKAKKVG